MMNAAQVIGEVCALGITLEARLWCSDPSRLSPELRVALRENQSQLVRFLLAEDRDGATERAPVDHLAEQHDDADERDALANEDRYATRQTVPQAAMLAGLLAVARAR